MTLVYMAARYSRRVELNGYKADLEATGHYEVTSRWLNGMHQLDNEGFPIGEDREHRFRTDDPNVDYLRAKFALDDYEDVRRADMLIAFTEEPRSQLTRGGRHVEFGIALGLHNQLVVIGPRENVFTWLPFVIHFDNWDQWKQEGFQL